MRRCLIGTATLAWLLLAACGGGQNAQTQEPQTGRGITDTTQLGGGARNGAAVPMPTVLGAVRDVVVAGETAYVLTAEGLTLVDLHVPTEPKVTTTVLLGSGARRVAVSGKRVYVACGDNGLKIVDLSKPRTPQIVGTYAPDTGGVEQVAAEGDLLLAGLGPLGVAVVDAAEPSAPAERKRLGNLKNPRDLALAGRWGYVLGDKLTVLDLSKPTEAKVAATFDPKDKALALALLGKRALLASAKQCLLLDVTTPEKPLRLAALSQADLLKQYPLPKLDADATRPTTTSGVPDRVTTPPPAKEPVVRLAADGDRAWLLRDQRVYALAPEARALAAAGVWDDLGALSLIAVADGQRVAVTAAGDLLVLGLDGRAAKTLGRLSLAAKAPVPSAGSVPPNPPTREGQAALDAVPTPKPAMPKPTPPSAD